MAQQLHTYAAEIRWRGAREGEGTVTNGNSGQGYQINVPPEFGGNGGRLNPEELLTDAISACYAITYGIVSANRRLPVIETKVNSVGSVEQNGANFVYRKIELDVAISLAEDATDEHARLAEEMAHKADLYCIVTNAVRDKVEVTINPRVIRGSATDPNPQPLRETEESDTPELDSDGYAGGQVPTEDAEVAEKPGSPTPTESSDQAGDPERMRVGAVPG